MTPTLAAAVLASRGGPRLQAALASIAWATERLVLDPARRLPREELPDGVRLAHELPESLSVDWLLLLEEHEIVPPPLAARIAEKVSAPVAFSAYRIGQEVRAFGATFHPRGAPVRLVRQPKARVAVGHDLSAELRGLARRAGRLPERLVVHGAESLAVAIDDLDADAATLAAVLAGRRIEPRLWHLVFPPLVAGARTFAGRTSRAGLSQRWTLTVLRAYRALLGYAKLWEMRQAELAAPR